MSCGLPTALCPSTHIMEHGAGTEHVVVMPQRTLRDSLESLVTTYVVQQGINAVLTPNGTALTTSQATLTIAPSSQIGVLTELIIDTMPDQIWMAGTAEGFNLSTFGVTNTNSILLTRMLLRRNIIPNNHLIIASRSMPPQLIFSNGINYNVDLVVTYTLGIVDKRQADILIQQYQNRRLIT